MLNQLYYQLVIPVDTPSPYIISSGKCEETGIHVRSRLSNWLKIYREQSKKTGIFLAFIAASCDA